MSDYSAYIAIQEKRFVHMVLEKRVYQAHNSEQDPAKLATQLAQYGAYAIYRVSYYAQTGKLLDY